MHASHRTLALRVYYLTAVGVGGVYLPFFPRWLEARGMVGLRLGVIAAAAPAAGVLAPTAVGVLADSFGLRGGLLQLACVGGLVTFVTLASAAVAGKSLGFGVLLVAAVAYALCRSPMGFIADVVALEQAPLGGTTYGRLRLWGSLGFIGAVPVAARFIDPRNASAFPLVMSAFLLAAFLASLGLPRRASLPALPEGRGARAMLQEGDFRLFLLAAFLGQCGHAAYDLCFSFRLLELGVPRSIFVVAWDLGTAAEVLMMAYSAPLFRTFSSLSLLAFALSCAMVRWVAISLARSAAVVLVVQPLHAFSFGLAWIAAVGYASRRFSPQWIATAQGLLSTAMGAGSLFGMVLWGFAYHRAGGPSVFAGAACFSASAGALVVLVERRARLGVRVVAN